MFRDIRFLKVWLKLWSTSATYTCATLNLVNSIAKKVCPVECDRNAITTVTTAEILQPRKIQLGGFHI